MTAKRVDANQAEIVRALRAAGRVVQDLHEVGKGCPDLLVLTPSGRFVLLEVKTPGGEVTESERHWHYKFVAGPVYVVRSAETALEVTG